MKQLAAFLLALLGTFASHGQGIIWSTTHSAGNSGTPGVDWQIAFDHVINPGDYYSPWTPPSLNPVASIFVQRLNTNDTGDTFFANAQNQPRFAGFVAGLTDGSNGYIRFQDGATNSWREQTEQGYLGRSALAPDLAGYTITQIGFRVNNFYDYFDVQEDRYFRQLDYSLDFYGVPVPEPGTWALLGLGSALLWSATRRRQK